LFGKFNPFVCNLYKATSTDVKTVKQSRRFKMQNNREEILLFCYTMLSTVYSDRLSVDYERWGTKTT